MRILELIQEIHKYHYNVGFGNDFEGMVRLELTYDFDKDFYEHEHIGYPDCSTEDLQPKVIECLERFLVLASKGNKK